MVKIKIIVTGLEKNRNIKLITDEYYKRISRWAKISEDFLPEVLIKNDGEIASKKQKEEKMQKSRKKFFS